MPVILSSEERSRLSKLAGMLGSSFDGERLAALAAIQKVADAKRVRIDELLLHGQTEVIREVVREVVRWREREPPKADPPITAEWRRDLQAALDIDAHSPFMTEWEANFATDILARKWNTPTEKQAAIVDRILGKLADRQPVKDGVA